MASRLHLPAFSSDNVVFVSFIVASAAPQRPHGNREIQPPQHDEVEYQGVNSVFTESGQDAGLRPPSPTAVLLGSGALLETWVER